jgi:DNA-binding NarL/FixJ family response regulator
MPKRRPASPALRTPTRSIHTSRASRPDSESVKTSRAAAKTRSLQPAPLDVGDGAGIRVLCVDDHEVLVEGLRAKFGVENRIRIIGTLGSAEKLLQEAARLRPDVILLDIEMPGPDVFEMAERLRRSHPGVRFVFLSAHVRDGYLAAAYKCGAWGYFAKGDELDDIAAGVREVAGSKAGRFVMGPKVRARCRPVPMGAARGQRHDTRVLVEGAPATALASLSGREVEILHLIGKGLSRAQVAAELSRSAKTIDRHQERMTKKLGLSSRTDLVRFAIREGFAEA